jgi:hypothetical protein
MKIDLKELLTEPDEVQRQFVASILGQQSSCIVANAVTPYQHVCASDIPALLQLRYLVDVETAINYHNRSEPVTQRINDRPDAAAVWREIYNQYIPGIATRAVAGDASGAWAAIMAMLVQVESQY